jgi:RNA polymerase-associated protein CTR9
MGICYYRLGNIEKAKFSFDRLLELEPNNPIAMVALAIIELANNNLDSHSRFKAGDLLEKAFQID